MLQPETGNESWHAMAFFLVKNRS